ncbi:hypothetical protein MKW94_002875, partial [Papaver nudicaule]|nr:hypothetical protein [Papaver nudicaule]
LLEGDNKGENIAKVSVTDRIDSQTVVENVDEGIRVTIDSSSVATITGSMVEQVQVVEGGEVAMMDCDELFETREVAPRTNVFAGNPSSLEDTQSVEAQAVGGVESERDMALVDGDLASDVHMTEHNGSVEGRDTGVDIVDGDKNVEAQTACGSSKSTANGNLCYEDETSEQGGKHDTVALVGEPVSHQVDGVEKMDSCLVNEKLDDGVHATVDPSSLPDGFQHTGLRIDSERIMENHVLGDGMLPDVSHENGAEINEMEGDTDFSVLVLDEELISDSVDVDNFEGNSIEIGDNFAGFEQRNNMEQEVVNTETLPEPNTPPGKEGEFSVHNPEDHAHPNNRNEKSLSDLMTTKKPDIDDHNHVDVNSNAPQSFKIGERILRIACQLTNGPSILKSGSKNPQGKGVKFLKKHSCQDLLSKLLLAARDHKKGHGVLPVIVGFFSEFRNSSSQNYPGLEQRKKSEHMVVSAQPFDFEGTKDSYWTDRIVQNTSDEQAAGKNSKGKEETDLLPNPTQKDNVSQAPGNPPRLLVTEVLLGDGNKELTLSTLKNRKRKENSDKENPPRSTDPGPPTKKSSPNRSRKKKEPPLVPANNNNTQLNDVQEKKGLTALLLKFTEPFPIPSVTNLNRMFRRFGPLKESETQVAKDTNQAIIVFKTHSDAEVALSSAGKFSIFGPVVVSYELSCFQLPAST